MPEILLYRTLTCPYCIAAARLLRDKKRVDFVEIDLTGDAVGRAELRERAGSRTVPQIWIGERHVGGYDDLRALDRSGELDGLLRP